MLIGEEALKLKRLMDSGFVDNDNFDKPVLLDNAPSDIVELFKWYMSILEKEEETGVNII